jgi:hypothetical protein
VLDKIFQTQDTLLERLWHLLLCSGRRAGSCSVGAIEKVMKLLGKCAADPTQIFKLNLIPGLVLLLGEIEYGPDQIPGKEISSISGGMEAMLLENGVSMGQVGFTACQIGSHGWCLELLNISFNGMNLTAWQQTKMHCMTCDS